MVYSIIHMIRQQRLDQKNNQIGLYYDKINMTDDMNIQDHNDDEPGASFI